MPFVTHQIIANHKATMAALFPKNSLDGKKLNKLQSHPRAITAGMLENALNFNTPINVRVAHNSGCKGNPKCQTFAYDMDILIDADRQFTFPEDQDVYRESKASDIIILFFHELIHGLGVNSFITKREFYGPSTVFLRSLFDTFLYDTNEFT
ncbi:hypothetical protein L0F63_003365 [Massospora cicadina]|nr:hypothetical protein L0F63_003365 [Massospora cicadina]